MTDQPSPFAPFQPSPPTQPAEIPPKTKKELAAENKASKAAAKEQGAPAPAKTKTALKNHAPKFDLQTTLAAAATLNEGDFPMFEKLIVMLDEAGKPTRDRLLAAIEKIFA